jgi:predicted dithiol-disulfide oxidoreductase (DUF899 family)
LHRSNTKSLSTAASEATMLDTATAHPKVASRSEWLVARKALLLKEKELTKQGDAVAAQLRRLPMVKLDKDYTFQGPNGKLSLLDLFEGRDQLIIYHFMFDPNDPPPGQTSPFSEGCPGCSHIADNLPHLSHVTARGVAFALVSRAPLAKINPFKARMGWTMPWYSSFGSDFNYDFHVTIDEAVAPVEYNFMDKETLARDQHIYHMKGEQPGLSVFFRVGDEVFHTYSTYGRGLDQFLVSHTLLDVTPFGRKEVWEDSPPGWPQKPTHEGWLRHHDKYETASKSCACCCKADKPA